MLGAKSEPCCPPRRPHYAPKTPPRRPTKLSRRPQDTKTPSRGPKTPPRPPKIPPRPLKTAPGSAQEPPEVLINWRGGTKAQPSTIRRASLRAPGRVNPLEDVEDRPTLLLRATWGGLRFRSAARIQRIPWLKKRQEAPKRFSRGLPEGYFFASLF